MARLVGGVMHSEGAGPPRILAPLLWVPPAASVCLRSEGGGVGHARGCVWHGKGEVSCEECRRGYGTVYVDWGMGDVVEGVVETLGIYRSVEVFY